jgi:hypothetical protein
VVWRAVMEWLARSSAGDEVSSPIGADTWDVKVIAQDSTPESRRVGRSPSKAPPPDAEDDGSGSDGSDFMEPEPAATRSGQKTGSKSPGAASAAKRRKLDYQVAEAGTGSGSKAGSARKKGESKMGVHKGSRAGRGRVGAKAKDAGKEEVVDVEDDEVKKEVIEVESDDDFAVMQPKKTEAADDMDEDDKPLASSCGKGKGKGGKNIHTNYRKPLNKTMNFMIKKKMNYIIGGGKRAKKPLFECERMCGFEGTREIVEAHEARCHFVPTVWDEKMDEEDEEEFLSKWESSVERQLSEKRDPPPGLLMPLLPFQRESLAWMCAQEGTKYKGGILAGTACPRLSHGGRCCAAYALHDARCTHTHTHTHTQTRWAWARPSRPSLSLWPTGPRALRSRARSSCVRSLRWCSGAARSSAIAPRAPSASPSTTAPSAPPTPRSLPSTTWC